MSEGGMPLERVTLWYARTIGTQDAPWLIRSEGRTFRAERVRFLGPTSTRLLTDEERERLPDKPRGVIDSTEVEAFGAEVLS